ncbi:aminopeptidase N-like [Saccoglossus kowalevskii]
MEKPKAGCFVSRFVGIVIIVTVALLITGAVLIAYYVPQCDEVEPAERSVGLPPEPDIPEESLEPFYGRLPDTLLPVHYNLYIKTYLDDEDGPDLQYTFSGTVEILINCLKSTDVITLHAHESVTVISATLTPEDGGDPTDDIDIQREYEFAFVHFNLQSSMIEGHNYVLYVTYTGSLKQSPPVGYYYSDYVVNGTNRRLASTQLGLTYARRAFPCFDEPDMKATFDVAMEYRNTRLALCNMPIISTTETSDGWEKTTFERTPTMSTYLIAFIVADYVNVTDYTKRGTPVSVWGSKEHMDILQYSLDMATKQLQIFEEILDVPYDLPKLDHIAIPKFYFGGMENWGIIMYRDSRITYDSASDPPSKMQNVNSLVSHETAHMWFGDLVTCQWWNHTWLNEGITSFVEYIGTHRTEPDWQVFEQVFQWSDLYKAFGADSTGDSHPVIYPVGTEEEVLNIFDTISYQKGASLAHMMAGFLSKDTLNDGFTSYLKEHNHDNVVSDDLFAALTEADKGGSNLNVKLIMDTWTLQMGYPVVTVWRDANTATILHTDQHHFLLDPDDEPSSKYGDLGYKWYVPITYTHGSEQEFKSPILKWQNRGPGDIVLDGANDNDWILLNINQTGSYRVNYQNDDWDRLANQLKEDHLVIPVRSRTALIADSFTISHGHQLDQVIAWKITEYMQMELEYNPWRALTDHIGTTKRMLKRTTGYGNYERYVRRQITPMYNELGWDFSSDEYLPYMNRINAINTACDHGNLHCIDESLRQYHSWMNTSDNTIRDDTKYTVYCTAIRYGGEREWEFAMEMYESQITPATEKSILQSAMACTRITWLVSRYIEYSDTEGWISEGIDNARRNSPVGYSIAWSYIEDNFADLLERDGNSSYSIVWGFSEDMNTQRDKNELTMFGVAYADMPTAAASGFYDALHQVDLNIAWMERNYVQLYSWFMEVTKNV